MDYFYQNIVHLQIRIFINHLCELLAFTEGSLLSDTFFIITSIRTFGEFIPVFYP